MPSVLVGLDAQSFHVVQFTFMMMIAFITIKSSLVPLIEGLCAQIYFRFQISVVLLTSSSFLFCEGRNVLKENKKAVSADFFEQIELQAKLLNYFLGSNKSNINHVQHRSGDCVMS